MNKIIYNKNIEDISCLSKKNKINRILYHNNPFSENDSNLKNFLQNDFILNRIYFLIKRPTFNLEYMKNFKSYHHIITKTILLENISLEKDHIIFFYNFNKDRIRVDFKNINDIGFISERRNNTIDNLLCI